MKNTVRYEIKTVKVKDLEITYNEMVTYNESGEQIYDRENEMKNFIELYDLYKKEKGLLTSFEIKKIREKYNLKQKDFSLLLGFGEITIHRYENGTIQTESSDNLMKMASNPMNMKEMVVSRGQFLEINEYKILLQRIETLINYKRHKIIKFNPQDFVCYEANTESVFNVADKIIELYNKAIDESNKKYKANSGYITNLVLQKMVYFTQGVFGAVYNKPAFDANLLAWKHGPVCKEIYNKYKHNGKNEIIQDSSLKLSKGLEEIINLVVQNYAAYGSQLIDLTHDELPWQTTEINNIISHDSILEYFKNVYID